MKTSTTLKPRKYQYFLYLGPGVLLYIFAVIIPILWALRYSFYNWSGGAKMDFVGLGNYIEICKDPLFWKSLSNNLIVVAICLIGQVGIAIIVATLLSSKYIKGRQFHRSVVFFPTVLSAIVVGFIWVIMYNNDYGLLNWFLNAIGLKSLIYPWLDDPKKVIYSISYPLIWQYIGYYAIILLAGMSNIGSEVLESCEIDGAVGWRKLVYIIYPLLKPTIAICAMMSIAGNMKIFDNIMAMTNGGPGSSSTVLAIYAYKQSFTFFRFGYGSAVSIVMLLVSVVIVSITKFSTRGENND